MKKLFTNLLGLALSVMVLASCSQMATYEQADVTPEEVAAAAKDGFNLTPFGAGGNENARTYANNSWETGCVPGNGTFANGDFYEKAFTPVLVQWGGQSGTSNSKTGNLTVYNTATKFVFRISSTAAISDLIINGVSQGVGTPANTVLSYEIDLPANWKAGDDYVFTVKYTGNGPQVVFPQTTYEYVGICTTTTLSAGTTEPICEGTEFNLIATVSTASGDVTGGFIQILNSLNVVVASAEVTSGNKQVQYSVPTGAEGSFTYSAQYVRSTPFFRYQGSVSATTSTVVVIECGCNESFSYVDNGDSQAYVFSYTPSESVTGANLVFTFAQGVAETATGLTGWSANGSTRQKSMDLVACTTYTWTVDLTPDCSGNSAKSNVWTDFKVNDVSKKNSGTPTIVESCSE